MTIQQALNVSERSVSARDAEVLLGYILRQSREWLLSHPEAVLSAEEEEQYAAALKRREQNEPVAYITGEKEFYGRLFLVDPRVLIPRPETEAAIELALAAIASRAETKVLELGTGSGNIAVTLACELSKKPGAGSILATDISADALTVAAANTRRYRNEISAEWQPEFIAADLFAHQKIKDRAPYDLIITNLPYVSTNWKTDREAPAEVVFYEPDVALFGGSDGMDLYRRFFAEAPTYLAAGGTIILEYNEFQTETLRAIAAEAFPAARIEIFPDFAGLDRIAVISPKN